MATTDFVVKNGLVVTDAADILSTADAASATDVTSSIHTAGGLAVAKKVFVGTDLTVGGNTAFTGDLAVNGGDLTTNQTTFNLLNATATTVNIASAATTIEIGAATGTTNINNNLDVDGDVNIDGGDLTVSSATFNLANTTATTGNLFGAATAVNIGATGLAGTTTIRTDNVVLNGDLQVQGGDLTTNQTTFNLVNATATTVNLAGAGTAISIGAATGTTTINNANTVVTGDLAVNGGDVTTNQTTFNFANTTATTGNLFGAGTAVTIGATTGTTTIRNANTVITGDLAVNGGDLTTNQTTFNLLNTTATTVNIAGAATAVEIGAATGTTSINNGLTVDGNTVLEGDLQVKGGDVTTNQTTFNLLNATATTVNAFGAATTIEIGAATGTTNVNNNLDVDGDVNIDGGDLTVSTSTFNLANTTATTLNIGGAATTIEIGAATGTTNVNNNLDVDGDVNIDGGDLTVSTSTFNLANTTATTVNFAGAGTAVGIGAATGTTTINNNLIVSGNLTVNGDTTVINAATLAVEDLNITVAKDALNAAAANGAGLTVAGANATLTYLSAGDEWAFNKTIDVTGSADISGNVTVGGTLTTTGDITFTGDLAVNGGDITTSQTTFNLINTTATTGNLFGAGTAVTIGATTGTTTIRNANTVITGDLAVNGADITTTSTGTATVFNTNATTVNAFGAGTAVTIGATTGTTTIRNANTVVTGDLAVNGADITTTSTGTATVFNTNATGLNIGAAATAINIGAATGTTSIKHNLDVDGDVNIDGGDLTVSTTTFNLANTTATTVNAFGAGTTVNVGAVTGTTNIRNNLNVTGDLDIDGGDLTVSTAAFNLVNTTATTLNIGGAATTVELGAATGTTSVNNNLDVDLDLNVRGGDITTNQTTFNLLNTTATTVNFAGAATTLEIGAATGTTNVNNNLDVDGDVNIDGGDLTVSTTTFNLANTTASTVNFAGAATDVQIGAATGTTNINNNLNVVGDLDIDGGDLTASTSTFNLANTNATTVNFAGAATAVNIGLSGAGNFTNIRHSLEVQGSNLTTNQTTFNLLNTAATTVNFAGDGTAVTIGAANSGTTTIRTANTALNGDLAVNGGDITTNQTTFNLVNATATTGNLFGAGTAVTIGATTGTTTIRNANTVITGDLAVNGADITTTATGTATVFNTNATTVNAFGAASTLNVGAGTGTITVNNPTVTLANATVVNVNGLNPTFAATSTGTLTFFNTNLSTVTQFSSAGTLNIGNNTGNQTISIGNASTQSGFYYLGTGPTSTGNTKIIEIGTGGVSGSTTNIAIGSSFNSTTTINSGTVVGSLATQNVFNTVATTVNAFGAGTAVSIGAATGTTTINNANTVVTGDLAVNGGDITTTSTGTATIFNTNATTVNIGGEATAVNIGAATGTVTFNNPNITFAGDVAVNGGDITTNQTTFNLLNTTATTVNFAGAATTLEIGSASGTTNINNNLDVDGDVNIDGGNLTVGSMFFNLANTFASTVNFAGAASTVNIGASTGTLTVGNPTLTMTQGVAVNMNGANPVIASTNTGTASLFNSNITAINFGQAAAISMGSTALNTTVRGNLLVNGNTTLGDASADLVTFNANTANVPNALTFTIDDAIANNVSYPVAIRHTTSGTAVNGIGVGLQFVTETAGGVNRTGVAIESIATSAVNGAENFSFVVDTMTNGGTAVQALSVNNNTVTVGAVSTATTVNTQLSSNLTVTTGAAGVTSNGNTLALQGGLGGTTSGAGGAVNVFGGDASTSGTGGVATFRAGNATGTNIVGADTIIDAGQGTGTGRSGQIVFRTGPGGSSGSSRNALTTVLTLTSGGLEIPGNLTVGGNFTVDGLVTTVNSTTLTVDDKNIELGSVVAKSSLQATLATGTAVVTLTAGDTKGLIPGMSLTINLGPGAFGASAVIATVSSLTQFTASVNHAVAGAATFTAGGVSDFTADGGGITVKGTTDKTFNWIKSSGHWTANTNISAPALVSTVASGTAPFTVASNTVVTNLNADLLDGFNSAQASTVSTVAVRDASGDINVRLIRSEFADQATISGAMAFRVNNSTDNYIRFVNDTAAIRTFLSVPTRTGGDASGTWGISITGNAATASTVVNTVTGTNSVELVRGNMGDNDQGRILVGATATNSGFLEIATADDGTEPIHVRQYNGTFATIARTATLLDGSGNTSFPGTITAPTFSGALSGNATTATTATNQSGGTVSATTGAFSGRVIASATGRSFTIGGSPAGAPNAAVATQTSFLEIAAGSGGNTNSSGVVFHNPNISTSVLEYVNTTADNAFFNFRSDDITWDVRVNGNQVLHAANYTTYAPSLTGTGATGTWGINITGSAVNLSTTGSNWSTNGTISAVVGQLAWKNYGNSHVIFDASAGTAPNGTAVSNTNPQNNWSGTFPTLMGWNGANTYGVRVDSARVADNGGVTSVTATTPIVASASTGAVALSHAASGVAAGTYNSVTVNATGHVTAGSTVSFTETDTLATVTGRGASTSSALALGGTINSTADVRSLKNGGDTISSQFYFANAANNVAYNWQIDAGNRAALFGFTSSWNKIFTVDSSGNGVLTGSLSATSKSFLIPHPTKPGMQLRYGSLEGPENGVYVRGKLVDAEIIELPDYWTGLVHADSITVNLTAAAAGQQLYVERVENNCVHIVNETGKPVNCFYTVYGERKDIDKLEVEIG